MSIQLKTILGLIGISLLIGITGAVAVWQQYQQAERAAVIEASNLAETVGLVYVENLDEGPNNPEAQALITELNRTQERDIEIVSADHIILADAVLEDVGTTFGDDEAGEVFQTLADGTPRTFVEISDDYPQGIKQAVVPVRDNQDKIIAAAIVEYTSLYEELVAAANTSIFTTAAFAIAGLLLALIVGYFLSSSITSPILKLRDTALQIEKGNFDITIPVTSTDEIGTLSAAFNSMATQLRQTIASLEERVADRTRAVQLSADVSRRLSAILDQKQLITEIVEQIRGTFDYYHVHIYLYDPKQEYLVMSGGTGEAARTMLARGHRIEAGRGLVGRAATSRAPILVPDVTKDPGWLPNPLLPDTKAELAVPLAIGTNVLGVLDVQHNLVNGLTQEDQQIVQSIANQVAIALQNTRSYEQAQQQAERETAINTISQRLQSAVTLDDVLTIAARELGQTLGAQRVTATLAASQLAGDRAK